MNAQGIQRTQIFTAQGNILQLFYNPANSLVVVNLIAANEQGGTELLRQTLKEKQALRHTDNICAWCYPNKKYNAQPVLRHAHSHGVCKWHKKFILKKMKINLAKKA